MIGTHVLLAWRTIFKNFATNFTLNLIICSMYVIHVSVIIYHILATQMTPVWFSYKNGLHVKLLLCKKYLKLYFCLVIYSSLLSFWTINIVNTSHMLFQTSFILGNVWTVTALKCLSKLMLIFYMTFKAAFVYGYSTIVAGHFLAWGKSMWERWTVINCLISNSSQIDIHYDIVVNGPSN